MAKLNEMPSSVIVVSLQSSYGQGKHVYHCISLYNKQEGSLAVKSATILMAICNLVFKKRYIQIQGIVEIILFLHYYLLHIVYTRKKNFILFRTVLLNLPLGNLLLLLATDKYYVTINIRNRIIAKMHNFNRSILF